jgi:hypothetical protein
MHCPLVYPDHVDQEDMDRLERKFAENDIICCARKIQP